jgi:hypothetical protein
MKLGYIQNKMSESTEWVAQIFMHGMECLDEQEKHLTIYKRA